jgi:trk system potassium uptake protein TrkA
MNILLVSGSKKAYFLVKALIERGHHITLISKESDLCRCLSEAFEIPTVLGDAALTAVLEQAGIEKMDMVIALCENDAENLVICELAKKDYHVKKAVAFVNNPANIPFFQQNGIDHCISEADFLASLVSKENISSSIFKYLPPGNPEIVVKEVILDAKSKVLNKKLWEIPFPPQCLISCILRNGSAMIPQGSTECREDDKMIVVASADAIKETMSLLVGS